MVDTEAQFREQAAAFQSTFRQIQHEISTVIVGQQNLIDDVLIALFAGGNVLLEGVPGIGKTMLVNTLAQSIDCQFSRVQFTPDLMPSDIIGTRIVLEDESGTKHFTFQKGPVFTQILLADEVNRATPKTQSALLEAMQEKTVTVAGETHVLDAPFFVLATQNPLEMEGTYPLPEAQTDRFLFKLLVSFPGLDDLIEVARRTTRRESPKASAVINAEAFLNMMDVVRDVPVAEHVERYIASILLATHPNTEYSTPLVSRYVNYGGSPRGMQAMTLGGKVCALLDGRFNVAVEDIQRVAKPALRHRILLNFEGEAEDIAPDTILDEIIETVDVTVGA